MSVVVVPNAPPDAPDGVITLSESEAATLQSMEEAFGTALRHLGYARLRVLQGSSPQFEEVVMALEAQKAESAYQKAVGALASVHGIDAADSQSGWQFDASSRQFRKVAP